MYVHDMSILLIPIAAAIAGAQVNAQPHSKRTTTLYIMAILLLVIPVVSLFIRIPAWIGQVPLLIAFTVLSTLFWAARAKHESSLTVA
jgi:Ca2+/Na+ antiporter